LRTDSDRLSGPTRSRAAIKELEEFVEKNCKTQQSVEHILKTFQYETGHEPRKTMQYMESIEAYTGKIRLFKNNGELYIQWVGEQEPESLAEYAEKHPKVANLSEHGKEVFRIAELREKMLAGPCKEVCPNPGLNCEHCSGYKRFKAVP
jgi:hypothetical protein